nr:Eco57I restriction-modification methylase domain-containing protein [Chryseobacterium capnotolerans]
MVSAKRLNTKALQELLLYFLRERITHKNLEVKHLIVTNLYEWFIFDAYQFEYFFAKNKKLVKQFEDFETKRLSGISTDVFYKEIAKPFLDEVASQLEFTYFNLKDYASIVKNHSQRDDNKLIAIFKIFSPAHLLKLPFINDSNTLDKSFYNELLHIIGLTETKEAGKRLIERNKSGQRNLGSLLEDTIIQLDSLDKVNRINKPFLYGDSYEERLFNIALELNITWINRVLFLKLMEGQLVNYHRGDKAFLFLNFNKIRQYDDLNTLFFQVLARRYEDRNEDVKKAYEKVPYLNSSLFEPTELEHSTLIISNLKDEKKIPILPTTVLKDTTGKKRSGELNTLEYLFEFLDAYDFASEGTADILDENKTLINASVLGLIFEKINGYKDGSFYTPGFITMYMCKETLRKAVLQKFNEIKNWDCKSIVDLHNRINDIKEANEIVNSLRVCDPAVGSGHFLVSALNELIAIKNDLGILVDKFGKKLKDYNIEVQNDELIITDENGELFEYNPKIKESQRIQETLFHEKQTIIENCLFGVDINPNSVKICRLRLWIELLKNAYYKSENELETLPNIDINIKNGNSLINRFGLDSNLSSALKKTGISIEKYKEAVDLYRNAESKAQKWELEQVINNIKTGFRTEISKNSKEIKSLNLLRGEYYTKYQSEQLFETALTKAQQKDKKTLEAKIKKIEDFIEEIKNNKIYENAFEWRFEFPEVLDNEGNFIGFDAIIGNPPYIQLQKMGAESDALQQMEYETFAKTGDIYSLFYELGYDILKPKGILTFITSNKWMRAAYGESLRKFFAEKTNPEILIDFSGNQIFDTATVDTNILTFTRDKNRQQTEACIVKEKLLINLSDYFRQNSSLSSNFSNSETWVILTLIEQQIKEKIEKIGTPLKDWNIRINLQRNLNRV